MATTKIINQTGNTTALKGCVGTNAQQPATPTISVQYLVVGGGGTAGGSGSGGGGAGGLSTGTIAVPNNTDLSIVIGQGGLATTYSASSQPNGQDSGFYTIQGQGGGAGRHRNTGQPGGSGGGGGNTSPATAFTGGSGVSSQGNNGGSGTTAAIYVTGGGGGAGSVGDNGISSQSGHGGVGEITTLISTTNANASNANVGEQIGGSLYFAGGGGGGGVSATVSPTALAGNGGYGGGGAGSGQNSVLGVSGTINTGGGGGGGNAGTTDTAGGSGGSGVVILRYASSTTETIAGSLAGGTTTGTTTDCNYPTTAVALYQFESNGNDTCGNWNSTSEPGITYFTPGKFGYAANFTQTTSGVYLPKIIPITNDVSVSGWLKLGSTTTTNRLRFIEINATTVGYAGVLLVNYTPSSGEWRVNVGDGSTTDTLVLSHINILTQAVWYNVCVTRDDSSNVTKLYINGSEVDSETISATPTVQASAISVIGQYVGSSTGYGWLGDMDQVRLFSSVLTSAQVAMLYAENVGATKFTEGSDTVLVFKGGTGTINLTGSSVLGPKVGDLRTNTDQTSGGSTGGAMEHYISTGWRVLTNTSNSTLTTLNYPPGKTAMAVYPLQTNTDDVSTNYNATNNNITFPGSNGYWAGTGAGSFNGSTSVGVMQNSSTAFALQEFTYSVWMKPASSHYGFLWANYSYGHVGAGIATNWQTAGDIAYFWRNASSSPTAVDLASTGSYTVGTWMHVCITFSKTAGVANLYINGNNTTLGNSDSTLGAGYTQSFGSISGTAFGQLRSHDTTSGYYDGLLQQIRIYDSALSSSDVNLLYTET
jgi:hypothetical protein